jgi:hypothetical protein
MATRMYFHAANSTVSGTLPSTEQSTLTATKNGDAQTVNRLMDTTIGTSQTSIMIVSNASTSAQNFYFTKFVSLPLNQTNITAQTWTYNFAAKEELTTNQFPVSGSSDELYINIYVWRPSTGAKVGTIFDNATAAGVVNEPPANTEEAFQTPVTGTAVASAAVGDVIIAEIWFQCTQGSATAGDNFFYFDGTTVTTSLDTTVSNHASFLETPQNLVFVSPATDMDVTDTRVLTNKFITKV